MAVKLEFKNRKNFSRFLCEIDGMPESSIRRIMGDLYIDTPGMYKEEKRYYSCVEGYMRANMGSVAFDELENYWTLHVKK